MSGANGFTATTDGRCNTSKNNGAPGSQGSGALLLGGREC